MNQKKAKAIRRSLRGMGVDPSHAEYMAESPRFRALPTDKLDATGQPIMMRAEYPGTVSLKTGCGRWQYQAMKGAA